MSLTLNEYRALVRLDEPFAAEPANDEAGARLLTREITDALLASSPSLASSRWAGETADLSGRDRLTALLTVRPPQPYLPEALHALIDRLWGAERLGRVEQPVSALPTIAEELPGTRYPAADVCVLWQGDITTLGVDAIVNAANDALLGCFHPFHACIDNAIHAEAGPRLREDCDRLMTRQGAPEPTGRAKVTRGYHLPARYVLHTVGPIYEGNDPVPPVEDREALAASYRACLDLAAEVGDIRSLAFCCISTGVFGFPAEPAARIALETVADWLDAHPGKLDRVVFNVFSARDRALYEALLADSNLTPRTTR